MKFLLETARENKTKFMEDLARVLKDILGKYTEESDRASEYYNVKRDCSEWDYKQYNDAYIEHSAKAHKIMGEIVSIIGDISFNSLVRTFKSIRRNNRLNQEPTDERALAFAQVQPQSIGKIKSVGTKFFMPAKPDVLFEIVSIQNGIIEYKFVNDDKTYRVRAGEFQNALKNKKIQYKE